MNVLAIDTASPDASVALVSGSEIFVEALPPERRASEELLPALRRVLEAAGVAIADCDRIAVCAGPVGMSRLATLRWSPRSPANWVTDRSPGRSTSAMRWPPGSSRRSLRSAAGRSRSRPWHSLMAHGFLEAAGDLVDEPLRAVEMKRTSDLLFEYIDDFASSMATEYLTERDRWVTVEATHAVGASSAQAVPAPTVVAPPAAKHER